MMPPRDTVGPPGNGAGASGGGCVVVTNGALTVNGGTGLTNPVEEGPAMGGGGERVPVGRRGCNEIAWSSARRGRFLFPRRPASRLEGRPALGDGGQSGGRNDIKSTSRPSSWGCPAGCWLASSVSRCSRTVDKSRPLLRASVTHAWAKSQQSSAHAYENPHSARGRATASTVRLSIDPLSGRKLTVGTIDIFSRMRVRRYSPGTARSSQKR